MEIPEGARFMIKATRGAARGTSKLIALLVALIVATGAGVAATGSTAVAQTPACWNEAPVTTNGYPQWSTAPQMVIDPAKTYTATITTSKGDVVVQLYADKAPNTVNNFYCLAQNGYYNFVLFHRVITGFMIQSGDPTATGAGGPGYTFADELPGDDLNYEPGTLAMANSGPNTNGSQFFIVHGPDASTLPKNYSIFGKVTAGQEIVDAIAAVPVRESARGELSVPIASVGIISVTVAEA
jgi:cyclophilin family peptidyl-prolyl cis-trans isomerase